MLKSVLAGRRTVIRPLLLLALLLALVVPAPAGAVVDGQYDGNQHPNVGLIIGFNSQGFGVFSCTGTLINPTTVLTAAHCVSTELFPDVATFVIDFDPKLTQLPSGIYLIERYVVGTPDPHPSFRAGRETSQGAGGAADFLRNSAFDIGLLHLNARAASVFPGIQPATITGPGTNEIYRNGPKGALVLQVGYGVQRVGPPGQSSSYFIDYTRNQSMDRPMKVTDALLFLGANPNDAHGFGSPCFGDSGSPVFRDGVIINIFTFSSGCQNKGGGPRLDAGPGRDFLRSRGIVQ